MTLNDYTSPTLGFRGFFFDFTGSFIAPDALSHSLVLHPDLHKCFKETKHHEQHKIHHDFQFGKMTSSSSSANFTSLVHKTMNLTKSLNRNHHLVA